jgi:imidazolonepropionase-like amidohydrolase
MRVIVLAIALCSTVSPGAFGQNYSLIVRNATVLDTHTATTRAGMTIAIQGDRIAAVLRDAEGAGLRAPRVIDAGGRLVTPGFIDAHHHLGYAFPDSFTAGGGAVTKLSMTPDSIAGYRARWARMYLPHGVTVVRDVGDAEEHLPLWQSWSRPEPWAPDFFASGGALVSHEEGRTPYIGHAVVRDSLDAVARVRSYHAAGLRDVKLYWRLREAEFTSALREASRLGMHTTAHVDFGIVPIQRALDFGIRHLEHSHVVGVDALREEQSRRAWQRTRQELGDNPPAGFYWGILEHFNRQLPADSTLRQRISRMAREGVTLTTTMHIFAQHVGESLFQKTTGTHFDNSGAWTAAQKQRARAGYLRYSRSVVAMHRAGVQLAVGSDWLDPGRTILSEILLLHRAGIPMSEALSIATLGGARHLEREADFGSITPGRKAHLVMFDRSPLEVPGALLGAKTVIKDGRIYHIAERG